MNFVLLRRGLRKIEINEKGKKKKGNQIEKKIYGKLIQIKIY